MFKNQGISANSQCFEPGTHLKIVESNGTFLAKER